jgi:hypothetical protein
MSFCHFKDLPKNILNLLQAEYKQFQHTHTHILNTNIDYVFLMIKFPLAPAPGSAHARPSAQAPMDKRKVTVPERKEKDKCH